ncbi:hypothetical protein BGP_6664 [Beggiatoa sp. PS]|nr:hypothetical protein BGP_6664 [Beggiatoa sp. PS]
MHHIQNFVFHRSITNIDGRKSTANVDNVLTSRCISTSTGSSNSSLFKGTVIVAVDVVAISVRTIHWNSNRLIRCRCFPFSDKTCGINTTTIGNCPTITIYHIGTSSLSRRATCIYTVTTIKVNTGLKC